MPETPFARGDATPRAANGDTLRVDVRRSVVHWRGTKFWGPGKHESDVRLTSNLVDDEIHPTVHLYAGR